MSGQPIPSLPEPGRKTRFSLVGALAIIPFLSLALVLADPIAKFIFGGENPFPSVHEAARTNVTIFLNIVMWGVLVGCIALGVIVFTIVLPLVEKLYPSVARIFF
jgi:hypothetical protein